MSPCDPNHALQILGDMIDQWRNEFGGKTYHQMVLGAYFYPATLIIAMSKTKPYIYYEAALSALMTLRYSRSSMACRTKLNEENEDTCREIIRSLRRFDLAVLDILKWEHDMSLSSGIIEGMVSFFKKGQVQNRIRFGYGLQSSYVRHSLAVPMNHKAFQDAVTELCGRLEDYAEASYGSTWPSAKNSI